MKLRKGSHDATGLRFGIVVARFNKFVTSKLLNSCVEGLTKHGVKADDIEVVRVPGAFEIPLVARTMARAKRFDAVICLGAVIRGDTPHFDYISAETSRGIGQAALDADVPIIFGVLTTHTIAQAIEGLSRPNTTVAGKRPSPRSKWRRLCVYYSRGRRLHRRLSLESPESQAAGVAKGRG